VPVGDRSCREEAAFQPLGDTAKAAMLIACLAFRQD
jgi:hypothetical protein